MMERVDLIPDLIPEDHVFKTFEESLIWIKNNVENKTPSRDSTSLM